ncbi:MerR family transcriptional regulator [Lentibacillus sp. N15]|uniref:MerR family transcriptional regulator n=1 Tax=Lentibacillus songyuanensis TaxID=3136161 RepID=UPI0031BB3356
MKQLELLRISSLSRIVDVPPSTIANWVEEYHMFIPKTKKRGGMYYHPEAIGVLSFIKKYNDQNYEQSKIMDMLANQRFSKPTEQSLLDRQTSLHQGNYAENLFVVMQTIGKTVANVMSQEKMLQALQEQQSKHHRRMKIIEKRTEEIEDLKQAMQKIQQETPSSEEYQIKKQAFAQLFRSD